MKNIDKICFDSFNSKGLHLSLLASKFQSVQDSFKTVFVEPITSLINTSPISFIS